MIALPSYAQRWAEGHSQWVPHRQRCRTRLLEAVTIDHDMAKDFILTHHYSGSYPSVRCRVGIFECGELVGVATLGIPAGPKVLSAWTGYGQEEAIELNRFVLLDRVGYNAESHALKLMRRVLMQELPDLKALVAFSDPMWRDTLCGERVLPGHVGTIYQATNAAYRGRTGSRTLILDDDGRVISSRLVQKIRQHQPGHAYATQRLLDAGAPPRREHETAREWVTRALQSFRSFRHPGNHGYVWGLRRTVRYQSTSRYPKQPDPVQLGLIK